MNKRRYFCGGSLLAVALSFGVAGAALAQTQTAGAKPAPAPGAKPASLVEEVVVTGSLIRGTALDTALPVEVHSQEELERQGNPTALEFAKTLTIAGPTTGEAYYFSGVAPGVVSYNLRGIGSDKTLILLNGRRVSQNATNIPQVALARTEILKDGAAVTYGADAIGGVVNFITRDHYVGLEARGQYKYIDGSDGDYTGAFLAGVGEGDVNLMISGEYEHRSRLSTLDRDFAKKSLDPTNPGYNPAPWSTLTNLAGWLPRGALPATPSGTSAGSFAGEWGSAVAGIISDFTPQTCAAVGGRYDNSFTCAYNYISYYNLVEDNNIYRAYGQLNARVDDHMKAHVEVSYGQVDSPQIFGSPAQPVIQGPSLHTGATFQFYVPITNPFAAAFAASHGAPASTQGFTPVTYRVMAHGGNLYFGDGNGFGVPSRYESQTFRVSGALDGDLPDFGPLQDIGYDAALTYNNSRVYADSPDVIGYRLQEALYGFGGPNCHATDTNPARFGTQNAAQAGQNGCLYWNPFATNFASQPNLGLANPQFVSGAQNSEALTKWLFDARGSETTTQNLTGDLVFNGKVSAVSLPGGPIGWAVGFQARALEQRIRVPSDIYNGNTPCPWPAGYTSANGAGSPNLEDHPLPTTDPNFRGCTANSPGPFTFFGTLLPSYLDQQQVSYFGELELPVLDSVNLQLAARHEQFSNNLDTTVYKVAGRWRVWGPITLRGAYGTNYQAPPLGVIPGQVVNAVRSYTIAAGNWLGAQFVTDSSLRPATAKTWNVGAIWQSKGFASDHDMQIILDYFDIRTKDEIAQIADPNDIANLVFNGAGGTTTTCDPAQQPLLNRVTFNNGCTVGMGAVGTFASIRTQFGNGPGQITTGYDLQSTYHLPAWNGDLTLGLNATYLTKLDTGATVLDGVVIAPVKHRLGHLNFATVAAAAPRIRADFSANYALGNHNFRLGVDYVSAVNDERPGIQYGENGQAWITADFTYRFVWRKDWTFTATVENIFDRDPPPAQEELGYDPRLGNPLGRTFEIGVKKVF
jgi:outer membrane receptor protein involved in Fe transport